jgi:hypothetical protein
MTQFEFWGDLRTKKSMTSWAAGGWSGGWSGGDDSDGCDDAIQKIAQGYEIRNGSHNAGSYYQFGVYCPGEQWPGLRAKMRERDNREWSGETDVKRSLAQRFWNIVGVYYFGLLRLIGHKLAPVYAAIRLSRCHPYHQRNDPPRQKASDTPQLSVIVLRHD